MPKNIGLEECVARLRQVEAELQAERAFNYHAMKASELQRWGPDGYWTPFHIAAAREEALTARVAQLEQTLSALCPGGVRP